MTDLTKGIIEINGFTFKPGTKLDEVLAFFGDKVRVLELSTGPRVKFSKPFLISDDIYAYNFDFSPSGNLQNFGLLPVVSRELEGKYEQIARYSLAASKQWLKSAINGEPHTLNDSCVYYKFDSVDYFASVSADRDYGLVGGHIVVTFHEV